MRRKKNTQSDSDDSDDDGNDSDTTSSTTRSSPRNTTPTRFSSTHSSTNIATTKPAPGTSTAITSATGNGRGPGPMTTNNGRGNEKGTTTRITTALGQTSTTFWPITTSELTLAPSPQNSNTITIAVLAAVAGLVFIVIIILALCLAWRKWCQRLPVTGEETGGDKSTYHMYSEIDRTTVILDEEPKGASGYPATRAVPTAPSYDVILDNQINDGTYDKLHQKEKVESKNTYSVVDIRQVDLKDPLLNTYDVMSNITGKPVSVSGTLEPGPDETPRRSSDCNTDSNTNNSVTTETPDGGQYLLLEKIPENTETAVENEDQARSTEHDNYFKLEPRDFSQE